MNQLQMLQNELQSIGFQACNDMFFTLPLEPHYYRDTEGNHVILSSVNVCIFKGNNTTEDKLGCVTLAYRGTFKRKGCRQSFMHDVIKFVKVINNADEATEQIKSWMNEAQNICKQWKKIL